MADSNPDDELPSPHSGERERKSGVQGVAPTEMGTPVEASTPPWVGRVLDERYRITDVLGEGGMGAVFIAEHLKLHKEVALKVVRAELAGNGEVATRFAREAMATAQFEHPHVASAIDYGTLPEGGAYFVMQLVRGRSLRAILHKDGALPWRRVCHLGTQIADALSAARGKGIVHRDLKPENILVESRDDGSELVKILDFGIAHMAPSSGPAPEGAQAGSQLTRVGTVMGTPGYMSPEQAVGDKVDHRTDIYALGVVLWECTAGRSLWEAPDITAVIGRQMSETAPRLCDVVDDRSLPPALDTLLQRMTARSADARPESAADIRESLRQLETQPQSVVQLDVDRLSRPLRQAASSAVAHLKAQPRKAQVATAVSLLVLLVVPPWLLMRGGDDAQALPSPNVIQQVVNAAENVVEPVTKVGIPESLEKHVETMLEGKRSKDRRKAAKAILAYEAPDEVYEHILGIARLESVRTCKGRKKAIRSMAEDGDARYLPPLERLQGMKDTGCGFLKLEDCYSCIRGDLRRAVRSLNGD